MNPRRALRIEGIVVLVGASAIYSFLGGPLWLYALAFLVPDLSMVGYLGGRRLGSRTYNAAHTYVLSIAVVGVGLWTAIPLVTFLGAIWTAHIGFDRALGYGLKFPTGFGDTHLDPERFATENRFEEGRKAETGSRSTVGHSSR